MRPRLGAGTIAPSAIESPRFSEIVSTLADTPHGRGGALDLAPVLELSASGAPARVALDRTDPAQRALYERMGAAAEARGLVWGGRWQGFPDYPHIELRDWRRLPYPPGGVA